MSRPAESGAPPPSNNVCPLMLVPFPPLPWRHRLRLGPKNKAGRVIFLSPEALEALRDWCQYTLTLERAHERLISSVFHLNGRPIKKFYRSWRTATKLAKVPDQLFHDLRRSSVRNYVRSGAPERVVMAISGHKTRSIFDRYNIVSAWDLQAAASRVTAVRTGEALGKLVEFSERRSGKETR